MNRARSRALGALAAAAIAMAGCADELDKDGRLGRGEFEYQCGSGDAACNGADEIFGFDLDRDVLPIAVGGRFSMVFDGDADRLFPASEEVVSTDGSEFSFREPATIDFVAMRGDTVIDFADFTAVAVDGVGLFHDGARCGQTPILEAAPLVLAAAPLRGSEPLGGGMRYTWDLGDGAGPQSGLGNVVSLRGSFAGVRPVTVSLGEFTASCLVGITSGGASGTTTTATTTTTTSSGCGEACAPPCDDGTLEPGEACFSLPFTYATGNTPSGVALADFDGDAILDVATAHFNGATVTVRPGLGDGTLSQTQVTTDVGKQPRGLEAGDFDADGHLDLAVANGGSGTVSLLFGKGDLTFEPRVDLEVGGSPHTVRRGDFDGDGVLDLVVSLYGVGSIAFLEGEGGAFAPAVLFDAGSGAGELDVGDLDGDGALDVVVVNETQDALSVLLGNGDGTFAPRVATPVGVVPGSVTVSFLNADEALDVVVTNVGSATLTLLPGRGDGTFDPGETLNGGPVPSVVRQADLNADGLADLAVANAVSGSGTVSVLLGVASGGFAPPVAFQAGSLPAALAIGELDAPSGGPDLVVANNDTDTVSVVLFDSDG